MFCNKFNVNILTAYLIASGVEDAVVCPGSRNAIIVHNLNECAFRAAAGEGPLMRLHPVTDERSAAFVAIGLWLATRKPIVVCVTSGSALLNLLPGVVEAYYRHIPLILISADRPAEWVGQLDGQTLPQPNALLPYAKCWDIADDEHEDKLHALCNAALNATKENGGSPVHINVPLHEPLFEFNTKTLPNVTLETAETKCSDIEFSPAFMGALRSARRPAVIIGQWEEAPIPAIRKLREKGWAIFAENISNHDIYCDSLPEESIDFLIHIGGALVEKKLKLQLRNLKKLTVVRVDETHECPMTFGHVEHKIRSHPSAVLSKIADFPFDKIDEKDDKDHTTADNAISKVLLQQAKIDALFVGNSTAVRWANKHLRLSAPTYCNRGVNGIEGSLSVAAGYSLQAPKTTLCIIGDLSFFYDANALWNQQLTSNLRILLINNNKGGIFYKLPHLTESPALDNYIAAHHESNARGIAQSYRCSYIAAHTTNLSQDFEKLLARLLNEPSDRPVILEVNIEQS